MNLTRILTMALVGASAGLIAFSAFTPKRTQISPQATLQASSQTVVAVAKPLATATQTSSSTPSQDQSTTVLTQTNDTQQVDNAQQEQEGGEDNAL